MMASATRLFVSNLPENINHISLRDIFSSYGEVTNFDLKSKSGVENDKKAFAFVTICGSNFNVESCIKHFSNNDFQGHKLYVTRARESFLERLQREREQAQNQATRNEPTEINNETNFLNNTQNTHKRKFNDIGEINVIKKTKPLNIENNCNTKNKLLKQQNVNGDLNHSNSYNTNVNISCENDEKKMSSDKKRLDSIKKKRQEFNAKKNIIKTGLTSIDKQQNKKVIFSDNEDDPASKNVSIIHDNIESTKDKQSLFNDDGSGDEINFDIKEQFEGKKGKKVLELQSKYKSDRRFVLDERFVEEESASETEGDQNDESVELGQADEKSKQLDILQNLLGVTIKAKSTENANKTKPKLGMLRFDPSQPEHAKYLAPVEEKPEQIKKSKKKKKDKEAVAEEPQESETVVEKVEVSKEQFYNITDDLKEAMTQPKEFSLRSLFANDNVQNEVGEDESNFIPLQAKKKDKVKNPLQPNEKNPFVYDSSDSENEEDNTKAVEIENTTEKETKTVWRENLFFSNFDYRLKDGLLFFTKPQETEVQKDRRELKSLMKKRIYNKERKNNMFQKKLGDERKP